MSSLIPSLSTVIFGNPFQNYLSAFGIFVGLLVIFRLLKYVALKRLAYLTKKTANDLDDQLTALLSSLNFPVFIFLSLAFSLHSLKLPSALPGILNQVIFILLTLQAILSLSLLTDYFSRKLVSRANNPSEESALELLGKITKGTLWVIGILLVIQNLGYNITSLIAGLGIGGIAVGFALQNILGDIFSSFAIILDKPFKTGDYIVVGQHSGTVEKIGIKTTRIRALQGEEIVVSNQELTSARVQNFKKMQKRRVDFILGVAYDTPSSKLKKLLQQIETVINQESSAEFDRAHFNQFGESALILKVVYFVTDSQYLVYMDTHEKVLFALKDYCEKNQIEIAYPTQTVLLKKA